tara:strand:+ start:5039 stop:5968 length:930 start_codon:yes stop_codon:yes gene_type:complete
MEGSTVRRLDEEAICDLLGEDALRSLRARNRGGENAYKGYSYEEVFASHQIAQSAKNYFEDGVDGEAEWQSNTFVDDFVIRRDPEKEFKGYQLKNTENVSWENGSPSIETDFQRQFTCSTEEGYEDILLRLVCSSQKRTKELSESIPDSIESYSEAIHFPYKPQFLLLLEENDWIAEAFGWLSKHPAPKRIEMSNLAGVLIGAWRLLSPQATISSILDKARDMSPTLVRSLRSDEEAEMQLIPEFKELLSNLPHFEFSIERGFLQWSFGSGSTSGVLSNDCFSDAFQKIQMNVIGANPTSFEEIEGLLV